MQIPFRVVVDKFVQVIYSWFVGQVAAKIFGFWELNLKILEALILPLFLKKNIEKLLF
jgi:hypothetical protein